MMKLIKNGSLTIALLLTSAGFPFTSFAQDKKAEENIGNYRVEGIDVVQGRVFSKNQRHEFTFMGGLIANNTFLQYQAAQLKYTFHFREGLAFEGMYSRMFSQRKAILDDLANIPCPSPNSDINGDGNPDSKCGVTLASQPDPEVNVYFGNLVWSPVYGKFALFSKKIFHFDIFLVGGAGYIQNKHSNRFAFDVGAGLKLFVNDYSAVVVDFRNYIVRETKPFSTIANNRMISVGLSVFFPMHPVRE